MDLASLEDVAISVVWAVAIGLLCWFAYAATRSRGTRDDDSDPDD